MCAANYAIPQSLAKDLAGPYAIKLKSLERRLPRFVSDSGENGIRRLNDFFVIRLNNPNTRQAYAQAIGQFIAWCSSRGLSLSQVDSETVTSYVNQHPGSAPTVKQHRAALRMMFDWMVSGGVIPVNPARPVQGPRYAIRKGKTPVLDSTDARKLLDSIDTSNVIGLRDKALIGVMIYSFARVSAVVSMKVKDFYKSGRKCWFRLHEKAGKTHEVPAHHAVEIFVEEYVDSSGIKGDYELPLFRSARGRTGHLTERPMHRTDVLRMIKRRVKSAGFPENICCHTFRATGITAYLENGGTLEKAQAIAAHETPRSRQLYDRSSDRITLDEIERIQL